MASESDNTTNHVKPQSPTERREKKAAVSLTFDNPVLEVDSTHVNLILESPPHTFSRENWEHFDDDGGDGDDVKTGSLLSPQKAAGGAALGDVVSTDKVVHSNTAFSDSSATKPPASALSEEQTTALTTPQPVVYDARNVQTTVMAAGGVLTTLPYEPGVLSTRGITERFREMHRPLRARRMMLLKVFSVVAAILFFPTGIFSIYFAWRTKREFDSGIICGNIDRALKFARRTEHLIIMSIVLSLMLGILIFALLERANNNNGFNADHSYFDHDIMNG